MIFQKALLPLVLIGGFHLASSGWTQPVSAVSEAQTVPAGQNLQARKESSVDATTSEQIADLNALKKRLIGKLGVKVAEVNPTPFPGLFEAVVEGDVLYTDKNADFIIMGQLFDANSQKNLTAETKDRLNRIDFSALPLEDAVKVVRGNGERKIVVFSDPYCSFCKKLETTLQDMKDVTIYTFLYPVIRPNSREMSEDIWCAKDRSAAWQALMTEGTHPPKRSENCDISALDRNIALGKQLNVTGTPTVFVPNGQRAPGAVSKEYLEKMLLGLQ